MRCKAFAALDTPKDSDDVVGTRHVVDGAQASDSLVEVLVVWDRRDAASEVIVARDFEKVGRMAEASRIDPGSDASANFDLIQAGCGVPVDGKVSHPFHGLHHAVRSIGTGGNGPFVKKTVSEILKSEPHLNSHASKRTNTSGRGNMCSCPVGHPTWWS